MTRWRSWRSCWGCRHSETHRLENYDTAGQCLARGSFFTVGLRLGIPPVSAPIIGCTKRWGGGRVTHVWSRPSSLRPEHSRSDRHARRPFRIPPRLIPGIDTRVHWIHAGAAPRQSIPFRRPQVYGSLLSLQAIPADRRWAEQDIWNARQPKTAMAWPFVVSTSELGR